MSVVQNYRVHGRVIAPPGCVRRVRLDQPILTLQECGGLSAALKSKILHEPNRFKMQLFDWLAIDFRGRGLTAAVLRLSGTQQPGVGPLHAFGVYMSGLSHADDRAALASVRHEPALVGLLQEAFDWPSDAHRPYALLYFADQRSLDCRLLWDVLSAHNTAFFDQFGLAALL